MRDKIEACVKAWEERQAAEMLLDGPLHPAARGDLVDALLETVADGGDADTEGGDDRNDDTASSGSDKARRGRTRRS